MNFFKNIFPFVSFPPIYSFYEPPGTWLELVIIMSELTLALGLGVIPASLGADQAGGARHLSPGGRALVEEEATISSGHCAASEHRGHVLQRTRGHVTNGDSEANIIIVRSAIENFHLITCRNPSFSQCSEPGCGPI